MLSAVLTALQASIPGRPRTAHHRAGAVTASEKFSARLSIAARATPASSSVSGSRPTMWRTRSRPAASPPAWSPSRTAATCSCRLRCADSDDAATATARAPTHQPASRIAAPCRTAPAASDTARIRSAQHAPLRRRAGSGKVGRFQRRSIRSSRAPIQTTGWAIRANRAFGYPTAASMQRAARRRSRLVSNQRAIVTAAAAA